MFYVCLSVESLVSEFEGVDSECIRSVHGEASVVFIINWLLRKFPGSKVSPFQGRSA